MSAMLRRIFGATIAVFVVSGCGLIAEPTSSTGPLVLPVACINGVEGKAVRWCSGAECDDFAVDMPRGLPEAWLPYEVELPPGAYVESGITLPLNPGRPPVDLMVSDYGTAVVGADAASICYTLRMANGDAVTYCWAVGAVIP